MFLELLNKGIDVFRKTFPEFNFESELISDLIDRALHANGIIKYVRPIPSLTDNVKYRRLATNTIDYIQDFFFQQYKFVDGRIPNNRLEMAFARSDSLTRVLDFFKTSREGTAKTIRFGGGDTGDRILVRNAAKRQEPIPEITRSQANRAATQFIPKTNKGNPRTIRRYTTEIQKSTRERDAAQAQRFIPVYTGNIPSGIQNRNAVD